MLSRMDFPPYCYLLRNHRSVNTCKLNFMNVNLLLLALGVCDFDLIFITFWLLCCIITCRLPLSEDPALAMAFSVARRASAVPMLLVNGTFRRNVRSYLDSSILQHQLQRLSSHGSLKGYILCHLCLSYH